MFYVPSATPSTGSSDSGDGAPFVSASRNLASLLDEQRKKGIGAALLTITGLLFLYKYSLIETYYVFEHISSFQTAYFL